MRISDLTARLGGWPKRVLALCCLLAAAATAAGAHRSPASRSGSPVVVAARDLPAGSRLAAGDVRLRAWPDALRPPGALRRIGAAVGRRLSSAIRANEAITGTRLAGNDLTAGLPPALQAVPVTVSAAAAQGLVHVGDSVDLLVGDPPAALTSRSASARVVAEAVRVLAVSPQASGTEAEPDAVTIVVAADRAATLRIAAVSGRVLLAAVRNPP